MANKYVPIPKADTYKLIKEAQNGSKQAKETIINQNTGLVKKIAIKFVTGENEIEDLVQIGYIGLLKAIDKFDTSYDVMFSTYAVPMIMGEIKRFLRDNGKIKASRSIKSDIFALNKAKELLMQKNGQTPRISQLSELLGMPRERVVEVMNASATLLSISSLDNENKAEEINLYFSEGCPENSLDSIIVKSEIKKLPNKERKIVVLRYYKDMTQQDVAKIMGISQVQVSRIEKKALKIIREKMGE